MTQRLSEAIVALYRRPIGDVRQVFALSRREAERLPRLSWVAVISITAPSRPPADVDGFDHVLRVSFADVDFLSSTLSPRARAALSDAFTIEQAQAIRRFIESLPSEVTSVVVHCEGGYSRSSAVALALHRIYGYGIALGRIEQANPSVLSVMMRKPAPKQGARRGRV
ncbi:hypothetical protein QTN24_04765 [Cupriavidus sp. SZY C1]|nr:hypothetical protein [Cupriavidus sp. SZY C1]